MKNSALDSEFLSIRQSADTLGVHPNTIRNMIYKGEIPALRFGSRTIRIEKTVLLDTFSPYRAGEYGQWKTQ